MKNIHQFNRFSVGESMQKRMVFATSMEKHDKPAETVPVNPKDAKDTMDMTKQEAANALKSASKTLNQLKDGNNVTESPAEKLRKKVDAAFNEGKSAKVTTPSEIGTAIMDALRKTLTAEEMTTLKNSGSGTDGTVRIERIKGNVFKLVSDGTSLRMDNIPENMYNQQQ